MVKRVNGETFTNDPNDASGKHIDWDEVEKSEGDALDKEGREVWEMWKKSQGVEDDGEPY